VVGGGVDDDPLFGDSVDTLVDDANRRFVDFIRGADLFVCDSQYTPEEYPAKVGWGHSTWMNCLEWMEEGEADRLVLNHHEPLRCDEEMDAMLIEARAHAGTRGLDPRRISLSIEGEEIEV
jgi:ribonuclease BN (tRNA processing enzyme)